ncbi:MAG: hypothetical protein IH987_16495 [Planctomycetes bacterium]|nr:hypothetical protein [Planctomycetota bacterium]
MPTPHSRRSAPAPEFSDLTEAVERLTEYVRLLTMAVDELTDEVNWRNNQHRSLGCPSLSPCMTATPLGRVANDPRPDEFVSQQTPGVGSSSRKRTQQDLFD